MAATLWPKVPPNFVRTVLSGHSALGLVVGGLAYLLSLTGVLAVFMTDFERWEQPNVPEFAAMAPGALDRLYGEVMAAADGPADRLFITLPTAEAPRSAVYVGEQAWFATAEGALWGEVSHEWTHFLEHLHYYLSLPHTFGIAVVGLVGAAMVGLILSGLAAHPRIFRDAFALRWTSSPRLSQADLHNRLSVWGAPFHLVISLTGAYFGLAGVLLFLAGATVYGGDRGVQIAALAPAAEPSYLSVEAPGTRGQVIDVSATVPGQLVYAETWRFDGAGRFQSKLGATDGGLGQQTAWAMYPLHFGSFGGLPIRLAYGALGLALCVVVASGVNIWLVRRRAQGRPAPKAERLWIATVWGSGLALAVAAVGMLAWEIPAEPVFWGLAALLLIAAPFAPETRSFSRLLRLATAAAILLVLAVHAARFGADALGPTALPVSLSLLAIALALGASTLIGRAGAEPALQPAPAPGE